MITAIRAAGRFVGWEYFLAGVALCLLVSTLVFLAFRVNRNREAVTAFLLVQLVALEACDTIWSLYFFPGGGYVNRGAAWSMAVFVLTMPVFCGISCAVCTWLNKKSRGKVIRMRFRDND